MKRITHFFSCFCLVLCFLLQNFPTLYAQTTPTPTTGSDPCANATVLKMTCPANVVKEYINSDANAKFLIPFTSPVIDGGCKPYTIAATPAASTALGAGVNTITYKVTDSKGATATCSYTISVKIIDPCAGATLLKLTCASDIVRSYINSDTTAKFAVPISYPVIEGGCKPYTIKSVPAVGSTFGKGTTTVVYTVTDSKGISATCSQKVTVKITDPCAGAPLLKLICPRDTIRTFVNSDTTAKFRFNTGVPTIVGGCKPYTLKVTPAEGTAFGKGTTTVTYTVTDSKGITVTCSHKITVKITDPCAGATLLKVTCPADLVKEYINSDTTAKFYVYAPSPTIEGGCKPYTVKTLPTANTPLGKGIHTIIYTVTDSKGVTVTCSHKVTIKITDPCANATLLKLICPADVTREILSTDPTAKSPIPFTYPTIEGGCKPYKITFLPVAGTALGAGVHTITYTVTDSKGITATCAYKITVKVTDPCATATALKITCPKDTVRNVYLSNNGNGVQKPYYVNFPLPKVEGGCGRVTLTSNPLFGTPLPLGDNTIAYTIKDSKGAIATCSFKLTLKQVLLVRSAGASDVTIYPNPASQFVSIGFNGYESKSPVLVEIYNTLGLKAKQFEFNTLNGEPILLNTEDLTSGYYFIKISSTDGVFNVTKPMMITNE
jgi:large repetitive protein